MPTVAELYRATSTTNSQLVNDPGLRPAKSCTAEMGVPREFGPSTGRLTLFAENTRNALYRRRSMRAPTATSAACGTSTGSR